jgi:hypothetical protein
MPLSVATWTWYNMNITLFTVFKTNCCSYISIIFPKGDVCAEEEPKDKKGE